MTENKRFNDLRGYKRFDSYFDDCMQLWAVSDNENDNMLYPCTSENMANEFTKLLNELSEENEKLKVTISELEDYNEKLFEDKTEWQIKLQKIRDYAMENGGVKQDVIEKVVFE